MRYRQAAAYLTVAQSVMKEPERPDDYDYNHVGAGIAVLAAIGASGAICYALLGDRSRGQNHREALPLLGSVRYGAGEESQRKRRSNALENHLAKVLDLKDQSHYGTSLLDASAVKKVLRNAQHLVDAAGEVLGM